MNKVCRFSIPILFACIFVGGLIFVAGSSGQVLASDNSTQKWWLNKEFLKVPSQTQSNLLVTTLEDELNSDGDCSLREAIEAANTNTEVDACGTGDVLTDTITFEVEGTLVLNSQLEVIGGGPLVIDGGGVITTSGGSATRVWWIETDSHISLEQMDIVNGESDQGGALFNNSGSVSITNVTLFQNQASEGGAVYNLGNIRIQESAFLENNAYAVSGGVRNFGNLVIKDTSFIENTDQWSSGAVSSWGTMNIVHCTFIGNSSLGGGGAVGGGGQIMISQSTIYGNNSSSPAIGVAGDATIIDSIVSDNIGGGISSGYYGTGNITIENTSVSGNSASYGGGGIRINGNTTIVNSTISGNSSDTYGGGVFIYNSLDEFTFSIINSTISGNSAPTGGGISGYGTYGYGSGTLINTIVANSPSGGDCDVDNETITDGGHNLDSDGTCGLDPANGSLPNTDPILGPLQDNGGPTWTHELLPESPAIDAGDEDNYPLYDQRGMYRPIDGDTDGEAICDMGSYEAGGSFLIVNSLEDELNNDGDCSLREAIEAANTNTSVDACGTGNEIFDQVSFDVLGTITLSDQLTVVPAGTLFMKGGGKINLSGGGSTRILWVDSGSDLILRSLELSNGFAPAENGAGIYNDGLLTINDSTFQLNTALYGGGIYNSGELSLSNSTFSANSATYGGGIYDAGDMVISGSTFSGNNSNSGAGISNWGTMTITNSTFSTNLAYDQGGGIDNWGTMDMINSTVSQNSAGDGGAGGIYGDEAGTTALVNSIIADNQGGDCYGTITDSGHNLDSDGTCNLEPANGSLPNTDPLLGPLQDNGGTTLTHALLNGSPAIDAGDNGVCTSTDQRGSYRPLDGDGDRIATCDMGSFEAYTGYLLVDTLLDELENDGNCSLREALQAANTNLPVDGCGQGDVFTDTIIFGVDGTITLNSFLTVQGGGPIIIDGSDVVSISGGGTTNILLVEPGSNLTLLNLEIQNGNITGYYSSGLTNDHGEVTIINCIFSGNLTVDALGGAINNQGVLNISGSTFYSNTVWGDPGGVLCNDGVATITDSTFSDNQGYLGGAIENTGILTITNSTISGNASHWSGGGLNNSGVASIINSSISLNSVLEGSGGGIANSGSISIDNSTIFSNTAPTGGGISGGDAILLVNTIIANNQTGGDCSGNIVDNGHNLDSDGSCNLDPENGSLPNTDPRLGPLQDNGGPTWTHALLPGSPAIDAGDDAQCQPTDQRGVTRPRDGNGDGWAICDIGSYELEGPYVSPAAVTISGASEGIVGPVTYFTATVEPISTTLPLTYVWLASDHPPITRTAGLTDTAGWAWELPGTYAITVTASNPTGSVTGTHQISLSDVPISGLNASNDSPTLLGDPTTFTATVITGTNITFAWSFGDGAIGDGTMITHTYAEPGEYTAVVTATNSASSVTTTTLVTIFPGTNSIYLPLVMRSGSSVKGTLVPFSALPSLLDGLVVLVVMTSRKVSNRRDR